MKAELKIELPDGEEVVVEMSGKTMKELKHKIYLASFTEYYGEIENDMLQWREQNNIKKM